MRLKLRPLPEFPGYYAGNDGAIYSRKRGQPRRLKPYPNPVHGYHCVSLYRDDRPMYVSRKGVKFRLPTIRTIHTLIASVWLPPRPSKKHSVDHRDENKANCRPSNLRWLTQQRNYRSYLNNHPEFNRGENNAKHKLTDEAVLEIRAAKGHISGRVLALQFGVHKSAISHVWSGRTWKHLLERRAA